MLGLGPAALEVLADRRGHAPADVDPLERRRRRRLRPRARCRLQEEATFFGVAEEPRREGGRGWLADQDLAGLGAAFHLDGRRHAAPGQQELPVRLADEEEVEDVAVDS